MWEEGTFGRVWEYGRMVVWELGGVWSCGHVGSVVVWSCGECGVCGSVRCGEHKSVGVFLGWFFRGGGGGGFAILTEDGTMDEVFH